MNSDWKCIYEERFSGLEADVAELKARLNSKKEDIQSINKELLYDRQQQTELIEKVAKVVTLIEESQKQRSANNKKLEEVEKKIDKLQSEITDNKQDMVALSSSLSSFRNTMIGSIPVISILVTVALHFLPF